MKGPKRRVVIEIDVPGPLSELADATVAAVVESDVENFLPGVESADVRCERAGDRIHPNADECELIVFTEGSGGFDRLRDNVDELEEEHPGAEWVDFRIELFDCDC